MLKDLDQVIYFHRCRTVEEVLAIRRQYLAVSPDIAVLVVDMSALDPVAPDAHLVGVLTNMRRFFAAHVEIRLSRYPGYLPNFLSVCRLERQFILW